MQTGVIRFQDNALHVRRLGRGDALLFAFHGAGQKAQLFDSLERTIGHKYTIIAVELPGAGLSQWREPYVEKIALVTIVERFKLEQKVERFSVLAFGIGSLYALTLLEQRSSWVEQVLLFAPDGLKRRSWQSVVIRHFWAKSRVQKAIAHPGQATKLLQGLQRWGIIKKDWQPEISRFVTDAAFRELWQRLYPVHYKLVPEIQKVRWQVKKDKVAVHIFCPEDKPTMKKDAFQFAKKQDFTQVEFWPPEDFNNTTLVLQKAADILNPNH